MSSITSTLSTSPSGGLASTPWLRRALWIDVLFSGVAGVAMLADRALLATVLGLPAALLTGAALVSLVWAAALGTLARRATMPRALLWTVVLGNVAWVAVSVALLAVDWVRPTGLGTVFMVAQAIAVAVFADLQWWAMRRAEVPARR